MSRLTERMNRGAAPSLVQTGLTTGVLFLGRGGVAFVTLLIATSSMGAAARGQFALWMTTGSLVAIVAYAGLVPALRRCSTEDQGAGLLRPALAVVASRAAVLLCLVMPVVVLVVGGGWSVLRVAMVVVLTFVVAFQSATAASSAVVQRDRPVLVTFLVGSVALLAMVGVAALGGPIDADFLLILWLVTGIGAVVGGIWLTGFRPREVSTVKLLRATLKASPAELGLLVAWRIDVLVLGALVATSDVGRYAVAVAFAEIPFTLMTGLRMALLGQSGEDLAAIGRLARRSAAVGCSVGPVLGVGVAALIRVLFGEEFAGLTTTCAVLMPGAVLLGIAHLLIDSASTKTRSITAVTTVALVLNVGLNLVMIGPFGLAGAAIASTASYGLAAAGAYFFGGSHLALVRSDGRA